MTGKPQEPLTYGRMLEALRKIGLKFLEAGKTGQMVIAGGAAMCLVHRARTSTKDIDAFFEDKNSMQLYSYEVGEEFGWEPGWLNTAMECFIRETPPNEPFLSFPVNLVTSTEGKLS